MRRSSTAWVIVVVLISSIGAWLSSYPRGLHMHGVVVGMTEHEVKSKLGKPDQISDETHGWIYYFGAMAAGQEFLEVDFDANKRV